MKISIFIQILFGWLIAVPLSFIVPKKKNQWLFIGGGNGQFRDNVKYLFLHLQRQKPIDIFFYFLTEDRQVFKDLTTQGLPILLYPRFSTFVRILRSSMVIVDNLTWVRNGKYHLLLNCCKVQLWHGCSMKRLELDNPGELEKMKAWWKKIAVEASGRFPTYDYLLSTSKLNTDKIFTPAFRSKQIIEYGYPRNDVFFRQSDVLDLIGADGVTIETVKRHSAQGQKVVLYAPTFRDTGSGDDFIEKQALDIEKLNHFCRSNRILFVFKVHPFRKLTYDFDKLDQILRYKETADIYPLLPSVDLLITDYSSIFFDFLFTGRPILFFPYDYEKYTSKDRNLKYDYFWITPGPKCYSQDELQESVKQLLSSGEDPSARKRREIMDLSFTHQNGNFSADIFQFLKNAAE